MSEQITTQPFITLDEEGETRAEHLAAQWLTELDSAAEQEVQTYRFLTSGDLERIEREADAEVARMWSEPLPPVISPEAEPMPGVTDRFPVGVEGSAYRRDEESVPAEIEPETYWQTPTEPEPQEAPRKGLVAQWLGRTVPERLRTPRSRPRSAVGMALVALAASTLTGSQANEEPSPPAAAVSLPSHSSVASAPSQLESTELPTPIEETIVVTVEPGEGTSHIAQDQGITFDTSEQWDAFNRQTNPLFADAEGTYQDSGEHRLASPGRYEIPRSTIDAMHRAANQIRSNLS